MRKIAITQRLIKNKGYEETRECLDLNYSAFIYSCGFLPVLLPIKVDFNKYFKEINIDGILLTSGNDLSTFDKNDLSIARDNFEKTLIEYGIENYIPVFGICRGLQLIASYFGSDIEKIDGHVNTRHNLLLNNDSKYKHQLENLDFVNSFHNFGVKNITDELTVSATDENNSIEALEHKNYKIFAQMWHPERDQIFKNSQKNHVKNFFNEQLDDIIEIAINAGKIILEYYKKDNLQIEYKDDESPISIADRKSNDYIIRGLKQISNYPIVSEELQSDQYKKVKHHKYWLIDPLDGTKEFVNNDEDFTVNIALIVGDRPILGVVYAPAHDDVYYAIINGGSFKNGELILNNSGRKSLISAVSKNHSSHRTDNFLTKNNIHKVIKLGSSIKFCKLAEGAIDVYPRFNGTKEWDTAAGHIILKEAGCKIIDLVTKKEIKYNKDSILNNDFIASRIDLNFNHENDNTSRR